MGETVTSGVSIAPIDYQGLPGHWDEALARTGTPRQHWRKLAVELAHMGVDQLTRRWQIGQQLIHSNGITYNVYGDPQGMERPWVMDPIPLVLDGDEWRSIEAALIQRAILLNTILVDLYGDQRLIREKRLPAAMAFGNPHFLRSCFGISPPRGVFLQNYAADLARSPDGTWWVLADRTQAPSGLGYALENRMVSARTLPAIFNQCQVRPLTQFFERTSNALLTLAEQAKGNPRVVLLTPGPANETYFEHSFLARQSGIPLVEGDDLVVRENRVFLKTLAGLEPVDLIQRRLDDNFCDPLELRGDSLLGVPGLTQAVRSGHVTVANALGSGAMETPAYMAFLPGLCRDLLGEDLRMPSVATWWCGEERPRRYVLEHLEELVIKPTFRLSGQHPLFPNSMGSSAREGLARRILESPQDYVAQEQVALSTTPIRTDEGLAPRHVVLRVYAGWDGDSYSVMPGGLARVSTETKSLIVSMQMGGGSKDTWVLSDGDEPAQAHRAGRLSSAEPKAMGGLPSRVADNLFWLGRYTERVESNIRLVRALLPGLSGEQDYGRAVSLDTAVHLLTELDYLPAELKDSSLQEQRWQVQSYLSGIVYDPARDSSLGWNLKQIRHVAWQVKERLSEDTWRVLQQLDEDFSRTPPGNPEARLMAAGDLLDRAILSVSAFGGLLAESTTRGFGWRFLELGKRLERALDTAWLLRAALVRAPYDMDALLETLLHIGDSSITYRTRYLATPRTEPVLQVLLEDATNPRSLGFQLAALPEHLVHLPVSDPTAGKPRHRVLAEFALKSIRSYTIEDLAARDAEGNRSELERLLSTLIGNLHDLSNAIAAQHFSHLTRSRLSPSL